MGTDDWFSLQGSIQAVQALPFDYGEYQVRYGDPTSGLQMKEVFDAMRGLKTVADGYGSPRALRKRLLADPDILAAAARPKEDIYLSTAWTLQRAHEDAANLSRVLTSIPHSARGEPSAEVVDGIKSLFFDSDQLLDRVGQTTGHLTSLIHELQVIEGKLAEAQEKMRSYTSSSSHTMGALNKEIGELESQIKQLEKDREAAWAKWRDLTIAAVAVPAGIGIIGVGIMILLAIPTDGASFALGAAITTALAGAAATGLGIAAANARTAYEGLVKDVEDRSAFKKKRVAYRHDLGALDAQMKFTLPASTKVIDQITVIRDAWKSLGGEIQHKVSSLTVDNLSSGPWLKQAEMKAAADGWARVDQAITAFNINSLVDTQLLSFGSALPSDDPHWKQNLEKKIAA
jgi:hypothetical protein